MLTIYEEKKMTQPNKLDELKKLLNCNNLSDNWYLSYGLTEDRNNGLTSSNEHSDSFYNPTSETALTLFFLGNIDGWKQIRTLNHLPRTHESKWNKDFFNSVRILKNVYSKSQININFWNFLNEKFEIQGLDFKNSILLFEFEIMNTAFHSVGRNAFKSLSFLDINHIKKWSKFDAVLIEPNKKLFVLFESKFTSDIQLKTIKYPYINQIMRNLESAFFLTNHQDSLYKDWTFKYVVICSRKNDQYKLKLYSYILKSIEDSLTIFKNILENEYKSSIRNIEYFEKFEKEIPGSIVKIYWDELGDVLQSNQEDFFINYYNSLEGEIKEIQKKKFENIGIDIS